MSELPPEADPSLTSSPSTSPPRSSGRQAVLIILGFGVVMVGALWLYWELYTRPFRPLQNAIVARFPDCRPNVVGGRYKSHRADTPRILRLVVQMPVNDFDPATDVDLREGRALELARLASEYISLSEYDVLEIHLVQRLPEQPPRHWSRSGGIGEWEKRLESAREEQNSPSL